MSQKMIRCVSVLIVLAVAAAASHGGAGWVRVAPEPQDQSSSQERRYNADQRRRNGELLRSEREKKEEQQCLPQYKPGDNPPPLHRAAAMGSVEDVQKLLSDGAAIGSTDPANGWSALHYAAFFDRTEVAQLLIARKAPVNLGSGKAKVTPIVLAAARGNDRMVQLLFRAGADVNAISFAGTPLQFAAWNLDEDGVKLLLANGAKPEFRPAGGPTTLDAAEQGKADALKANHAKITLSAEPPIAVPRATGPICPRCGGTGRRPQEEIDQLVSAAAAQAVASGTSGRIPIDYTCPTCKGAGRLLTAEDLRLAQLASEAAQRRQEQLAAAYEKADAPILRTYNDIVAAIVAFSATGSKNAEESKRIKQSVTNAYAGDAWKPAPRGEETSVVPTPVSSATRPAVGRITTLKAAPAIAAVNGIAKQERSPAPVEKIKPGSDDKTPQPQSPTPTRPESGASGKLVPDLEQFKATIGTGTVVHVSPNSPSGYAIGRVARGTVVVLQIRLGQMEGLGQSRDGKPGCRGDGASKR